jgi:hypothetical protein
VKPGPLRRRLGFSCSEWSRILGVHERTVRRWEDEDVDPGGVADAVMRGIGNALDDGAELASVKRQLVDGGVSLLICHSLRRI